MILGINMVSHLHNQLVCMRTCTTDRQTDVHKHAHTNVHTHIPHTQHIHTHVDASNTSAAFYSHMPYMYTWYTSTVHTTQIIMRRIYW